MSKPAISFDYRAPKFSNARALIRSPYVTARTTRPIRWNEILMAASAAVVFVLVLF
jgi:hypothetical protein